MPPNTSKPQSEAELLARCQALTGQTLETLAQYCQQSIPQSLLHAKGWIGQLMELYLGADGTNQSQPDFAHLGIELKTIPLNANMQPRESTYVCTAPLARPHHLSLLPQQWQDSRVRHKLAKVLWVPVEADPAIPLPKRHVGSPLLWVLPSDLESILQQDWEELTEMLHCGQIAHISAKQGVYLHIRPKAAHSRILNATHDEDGETLWINPKGFYLRSSFTQQILDTHYCH
jgi:DNA mismatch repair protein MutH